MQSIDLEVLQPACRSGETSNQARVRTHAPPQTLSAPHRPTSDALLLLQLAGCGTTRALAAPATALGGVTHDEDRGSVASPIGDRLSYGMLDRDSCGVLDRGAHGGDHNSAPCMSSLDSAATAARIHHSAAPCSMTAPTAAMAARSVRAYWSASRKAVGPPAGVPVVSRRGY